MNYLLLLTLPEGASPGDGWGTLSDEMRQAGAYVLASGLEASDAATTLRVSGGERTVTGGPFAVTEENLFACYVIDVPDLEAAIAWAEKMPIGPDGSVEIRPTVGFELG